jgi:hypothetical protein
LVIYLSDRPAGHAVVLPASLHWSGGPSLGVVGWWLPSLLHPFAFALLTAAAARPSAASTIGACAGWWGVNVVFEVAQHPRLSAPIAAWLDSRFDGAWPAQRVADYLVRGTFDVGDLVAASLGALLAAAVLGRRQPNEPPDAH